MRAGGLSSLNLRLKTDYCRKRAYHNYDTIDTGHEAVVHGCLITALRICALPCMGVLEEGNMGLLLVCQFLNQLD